VTEPRTKESGNDLLTRRLRDVDEQNAVIVRRQAADRIDLYEATIVAVVEKEQAARDELDALREAAQALVTARAEGTRIEPWDALIAALERHP
jgi:hypothetical protein